MSNTIGAFVFQSAVRVPSGCIAIFSQLTLKLFGQKAAPNPEFAVGGWGLLVVIGGGVLRQDKRQDEYMPHDGNPLGGESHPKNYLIDSGRREITRVATPR